MFESKRGRSLALSAILASSVLPALGLAASDAHAVNAGAADSALTISDGSSTVVIGGKAVAFPTTVTDAAWAPDGSRLAYVDAAGDLVTSLADGSGGRLLAHGGPGIVFSHPTWNSDGGGVAYAESVNGKLGPIKLVSDDGSAFSDYPQTTDGMAYSAPDAVFVPDGTSPARSIVPDLVFQQDPGAHPIVSMMADWAKQPVLTAIADGSQPTVSPDGKSVAYVDYTGQISVVDVTNPFIPGRPKVLTTDGTHKQHPTFSPDGSKIAYEAFTPGTDGAADVAKDVESIPAAGGAATVESPKPGVPAYRTAVPDHVTRLAGADRIGTALAVSQARFPNPATAEARPQSVVLSRSDQFADALAGSFLAQNSPLLLTPTGALDPAVKNEIVRVLGPVDSTRPQTVYLLGGPQALSPRVQQDVEALGYKVQRLAGADRYATSVAIARTADHPHAVEVATGDNFADALSAGATGNPVVLTDDKKMPAVTADYLNSVTHPTSFPAPTVYAVGGQAKTATEALWPTGSANRPKLVPLAGIDRFETSYLVAREFFGSDGLPGHVYLGVATAANWPDSLPGGALMNGLRGPLLLADPHTGLTDQEKQWVSTISGTVDSSLIFGGPEAISPTVDAQLGALLSGPAGYVHQTNPPSIPK